MSTASSPAASAPISSAASSPATTNPCPARPFVPIDPGIASIPKSDAVLLGALVGSDDPLSEVIRDHKLSLRGLARWASREDICKVIEAVTRLHTARVRIPLLVAAQSAVLALKLMAMSKRPDLEGITRRAATTTPPAPPTAASPPLTIRGT